VLEATGSKSKFVNKPLPEDDPKVRKPDISKARRVLGWEPKIELADGLRVTVRYFEELGIPTGHQGNGRRRPKYRAAERGVGRKSLRVRGPGDHRQGDRFDVIFPLRSCSRLAPREPPTR